jgi:hypothetical protein
VQLVLSLPQVLQQVLVLLCPASCPVPSVAGSAAEAAATERGCWHCHTAVPRHSLLQGYLLLLVGVLLMVELQCQLL